MKRDPNIRRLLRGELLACSPLEYGRVRDEMMEALLDLIPAYTQRSPKDPGVAIVEALAGLIHVFGFYHDRILTESKIGTAQLLQSVTQLGDIVGYTPTPSIAALAHQFFEARILGSIPAGSKVAGRPIDGTGKIIFETLRHLALGPAFNKMRLDPIIARYIGAKRAVLTRHTPNPDDATTPFDAFKPRDYTLFNGFSGQELVQTSRARSRAVEVTRPLRRSYGVEGNVYCSTEYRHLQNPQKLSSESDNGHDDLVVFEVSERPILHIPHSDHPERVESTLEVYVFSPKGDTRNPQTWMPEQRWKEVTDFSASEVADLHYRTFVDDMLRTYVIFRRAVGARTLLTDDDLEHVYARFTPAVGNLVPDTNLEEPPKLVDYVVNLNSEYFTNPLILPQVDGEAIRTEPSDWVVTDVSLGLLPGRQIVIENVETEEKFVRTLGPRTVDQYISWQPTLGETGLPIEVPDQIDWPLWDRIATRILDIAEDYNELINDDPDDDDPPDEPDPRWETGLLLQTFGHYFPLSLATDEAQGSEAPPMRYSVLPGRGVRHNIPEALLYVEEIPDMHLAIEGWSKPDSLSISPLRSAAKAGPYHLWDDFYRHFENLDWAFRDSEDLSGAIANPIQFDPDSEELPEQWWKPEGLKEVVIVPRGSTYIIIQDTSLVRPGDYFLIGKRVRYCCPLEEKSGPLKNRIGGELGIIDDEEIGDRPNPEDKKRSLDPKWIVAEILQAIEVQGKIVRLKWPTQNEYTVDFQTNENTPEPITELIIVPQVASVFYGEYFRQKIQLRPSQFIITDSTDEAEYPAILIEEPFDAKGLRESTGWDLKNSEFGSVWNDIYLITDEDVPKLVPNDDNSSLFGGALLQLDSWPDSLEPGPDLTLKLGREKPTTYKELELAPPLVLASSASDIVLLDPVMLYEIWKEEDNYNTHGYIWLLPADVSWEGVVTIVESDDPDIAIRTISFPQEVADAIEGAILKVGLFHYVQVISIQNQNANFEDLGNFPPTVGEQDISLFAARRKIEEHSIGILVSNENDFGERVFLPEDSENQDSPDFQLNLIITPKEIPFTTSFKLLEGRVTDADDFTTTVNLLETLVADDGALKNRAYFAFENMRHNLDQDHYSYYTEAEGTPPVKPYNFLREPDEEPIGALIITEIGEGGLNPGKYILFSHKSGHEEEMGAKGVQGTLTEEVLLAEKRLTASVIFNSGNFIPVRFGDEDLDHTIVENSLSVQVDTPNGLKQVQYIHNLMDFLQGANVDFEEEIRAYLFGFNKTPEGTFTLNFYFKGTFAKELSAITAYIDVIYTAQDYQELLDGRQFLHRAEYSICPDEPSLWWNEYRVYEFETRPLPWNPLRQLVILNSGNLKAGDMLFVEPSDIEERESACFDEPLSLPAEVADAEATQARDYIQWTHVVEVDGRIVMVDPPLKIQPRGYYHYRVTGYRRPGDAAKPDKDYYSLLQHEKKDVEEPSTGLLSFKNRLMLRPFDEVNPDPPALVPSKKTWLLDHIVPGDRILVWDERWRNAWHAHRVGLSESEESKWFDWPDHQHEVVVKRIIPRLGVVEIEVRMPPRFSVAYASTLNSEVMSPEVSVENFRGLPFYRRPFQGPRKLVAIGDGDRRLRFPSYTGLVDRFFQFASVALSHPHALASNLEVLTVENDEWARWTEFSEINDARAKDRACVIGMQRELIFRGREQEDLAPKPGRRSCCANEEDSDLPPSPSPDAIPTESAVSVSFGDGLTGRRLPNGTGNIFIRPVTLERSYGDSVIPKPRRILSSSSGCLPFRIGLPTVSAKNLVLEVEHGAHHNWHPRGTDTRRWRPSIQLVVNLADPEPQLPLSDELLAELERDLPRDGILKLHEITDEEALEGKDGLIVRPLRPGVVSVFVVLGYNLTQLSEYDSRLQVLCLPRNELWDLDRDFYGRVLENDPSTASGSKIVLLSETQGLTEGSLLAFYPQDTPTLEPEIARVKSVEHSTFSATLEQGLKHVYGLEQAIMRGNIVEVVQGSSERSVLGSGDGTTRSLRVPLGNRGPILYANSRGTHEDALVPGVEILVDDRPWELVDNFEGRGPRDRIFRLDFSGDGTCTVCFGDGVTGAIPSAGLDNIEAVVRIGDGASGNVALGGINKLLDGNLAVERTSNLTPGVGGKPADDATQAREHLMTRSFQHGRVVTRKDVLRALLALSNVVQAQLVPSTKPTDLDVRIVLAKRQQTTPLTLAALHHRVEGIMPLGAGLALYLSGATFAEVHIVLEVSIIQGYFAGEVLTALEEKFRASDEGFFAPENWPIGGPIRAGDIYECVFTIPGVATAQLRWLSREPEPLSLPMHVPEVLFVAPNEAVCCDSSPARRVGGRFRVQIEVGGPT